jgi:hypothetical protein
MTPFQVETGTEAPLAIVPRPRGNDWLEDEVSKLKQAGVDVLVSMLQPAEAAELGLSAEAGLCAAGGIEFRSFPVPDRETPLSTSAFAKFVKELQIQVHAGRSVDVHCRASIGSSSLAFSGVADRRRVYT